MTDFFKFRQIIEEKNNRLNEASTKELKDLDIGDDVMVNGEMGMFYGMQGSKVKVRFPSGQKTVSAKDVEIKDLMMDDLEKDADDPCWEGYVQVGTKMEDGKEVPNCVPIEEARKQMDEASRKTEKELSKLMTKALDGKRPKSDYTSEIANNGDFVVKDGGGRVVGRIKKGDFEDPMKENVNESYYDYPDYGPVGASEMAQTQLHFIKYAADDVTRCLKSGCPMPEWYQNKLAKIEGDMEGLYSYMKGKTRKMKAHQSDRYSMGMRMYGEETLTEAKSVGSYVWKSAMDNPFAVTATVRGVKGERVKSFDNLEDAIKVADKHKDAQVTHNVSGKVLYKNGRKTRDARMYEETLSEQAKSGSGEAYDKFFRAALRRFDVEDPGDLSKEKRKEFFNYIDKNWKSDKELKKESTQIDEKSLARKINKMLSFTADKPDEMRREIGKMSDDELLKLKGAANENPGSGSARKLQIDLINREMKKRNLKESYINEKLKPSDDVSKWIEDFYDSDAPQFKGKDKEERREMAVAAWLEARREAGYDVDPNPNEE